MMTEKRYQSWGDFLKKRRQERYRSAREFCAKVSVGISYPQYSRYEAGDQLPSLDQALQLCRLLGVPPLEGLLEWSRTQISDGAALSDVNVLLGKVRNGAASGGVTSELSDPARDNRVTVKSQTSGQSAVSLDDVIVFNRSHLKLFSSHPAYRDIFAYINAFSPEWISAEEISLALEIPLNELEPMLEELNDLGMILLVGGKCRVTKSNFYYPEDKDFFQLRNVNFTHNASQIVSGLTHESLTNRNAFRSVITRELSSEQVSWLISHLENMSNDVLQMRTEPTAEQVFSFCVLLGERFRRPQAAEVEALKRSEKGTEAPKRDGSSLLLSTN